MVPTDMQREITGTKKLAYIQ